MVRRDTLELPVAMLRGQLRNLGPAPQPIEIGLSPDGRYCWNSSGLLNGTSPFDVPHITPPTLDGPRKHRTISRTERDPIDTMRRQVPRRRRAQSRKTTAHRLLRFGLDAPYAYAHFDRHLALRGTAIGIFRTDENLVSKCAARPKRHTSIHSVPPARQHGVVIRGEN